MRSYKTPPPTGLESPELPLNRCGQACNYDSRFTAQVFAPMPTADAGRLLENRSWPVQTLWHWPPAVLFLQNHRTALRLHCLLHCHGLCAPDGGRSRQTGIKIVCLYCSIAMSTSICTSTYRTIRKNQLWKSLFTRKVIII
jgi:hypothetical protein